MISPGIHYDWWCRKHDADFIIVARQSSGHGGPIRACPECVRIARDRVETETNRWMKTHGRFGGWQPFEGWH